MVLKASKLPPSLAIVTGMCPPACVSPSVLNMSMRGLLHVTRSVLNYDIATR